MVIKSNERRSFEGSRSKSMAIANEYVNELTILDLAIATCVSFMYIRFNNSCG